MLMKMLHDHGISISYDSLCTVGDTVVSMYVEEEDVCEVKVIYRFSDG